MAGLPASARRKRKLYQAEELSGGIPVVNPSEAGRVAPEQVPGAGVAPPWFAAAMGPVQAQLANIQAQLANITISRNNERVSHKFRSLVHL